MVTSAGVGRSEVVLIRPAKYDDNSHLLRHLEAGVTLAAFLVDHEERCAIGLEDLTDFQGEGLDHLLEPAVERLVVAHLDERQEPLRLAKLRARAFES